VPEPFLLLVGGLVGCLTIGLLLWPEIAVCGGATWRTTPGSPSRSGMSRRSARSTA